MDIVVTDVVDEAHLRPAMRLALRMQLRRAWWLGLAVLVLGVLSFLVDLEHGRLRGTTIIIGVTALLLVVVMPLTLRWSVDRTIRATPGYGQPRRVHLTGAGISMETPITKAFIDWAAISGSVARPGVLLLRHGKAFVPLTTAGMTAEQVAQVRAMAGAPRTAVTAAGR